MTLIIVGVYAFLQAVCLETWNSCELQLKKTILNYQALLYTVFYFNIGGSRCVLPQRNIHIKKNRNSFHGIQAAIRNRLVLVERCH